MKKLKLALSVLASVVLMFATLESSAQAGNLKDIKLKNAYITLEMAESSYNSQEHVTPVNRQGVALSDGLDLVNKHYVIIYVTLKDGSTVRSMVKTEELREIVHTASQRENGKKCYVLLEFYNNDEVPAGYDISPESVSRGENLYRSGYMPIYCKVTSRT